jgi:hypothetical protein
VSESYVVSTTLTAHDSPLLRELEQIAKAALVVDEALLKVGGTSGFRSLGRAATSIGAGFGRATAAVDRFGQVHASTMDAALRNISPLIAATERLAQATQQAVGAQRSMGRMSASGGSSVVRMPSSRDSGVAFANENGPGGVRQVVPIGASVPRNGANTNDAGGGTMPRPPGYGGASVPAAGSAPAALAAGPWGPRNGPPAVPPGGFDAMGGFALSGAGQVIGGAGRETLGFLDRALDAAAEYRHQVELLHVANISGKELADAQTAAWKATGDVQTSTPAANLRAIGELRSVLGSTAEAINFMPDLQRLQATLQSVTGKKQENLAYNTMRAVEMLGGTVDPLTGKTGTEAAMARTRAYLDFMTRAAIVTHGNVGPEALLGFAQQVGPSARNMTLDALMQLVPLIGETGGKRAATIMAALNQQIAGGVMPQRQVDEWVQVGLLNPRMLKETKTGVQVLPGAIKDEKLFKENPALWFETDFIPQLKANGFASNSEIIDKITRLMSRQTGQRGAADIAMQLFQIHRDYEFEKQSLGSASFADLAKSDPEIAKQMYRAQWETAMTGLGDAMIPAMLPVLHGLADAFGAIGRFAEAHPTIAGLITDTAGALGVLAVAIGTLATVVGGALVLKLGVPALLRGAAAAAGAGGAAALAEGGAAVAAGAGGVGLGAFLMRAAGPIGGILYMKAHQDEYQASMQDQIDQFKRMDDAADAAIDSSPTLGGKVASWLRYQFWAPESARGAGATDAASAANLTGSGTSTGSSLDKVEDLLRQVITAIQQQAGHVVMDGQKVGEVVSRYIDDQGGGMRTSGGSFDTSAGHMPPGTVLTGP